MIRTEYKQRISPNRSERKAGDKITCIVIHYTGSMSLEGCLAWFDNPESKVSAHYVIGRGGEIVQCVPENQKAWHAGQSEWKGKKNVNGFSIGIELVGMADVAFTELQYHALIVLTRKILNRYPIPQADIIGHSDIAPGRKVDPGKLFDWTRVRADLFSSDLTPTGHDESEAARFKARMKPGQDIGIMSRLMDCLNSLKRGRA